ncbi:MAG: bifunctional oligoribonuclease/PAP phosphatase NrnA [Abditibacteriota bacterium]|nr:bifunctional oligoribonuclease/PAP phosphatase NrnA [Abditibacteriota bacterium]
MNSIYYDFWGNIIKHNNILIGIHEHPDGDCIGSALAIQRVLKKQFGKKATIYSPESIPSCTKFLTGVNNILIKEKPDDYDLLLLVDVNTVKRTGIPQSMLCENIYCIDHHERGSITYPNEIIIPEASSTCEIIYNLLIANECPIDKVCAEYLLTGIICDTGDYAHTNTNEKVFLISSELTKIGANPTKINKFYFNEKSFKSLKLVGYVLNNLLSFERGKLILGYVDYNYLSKNKRYGIDSDTINGQLQSIKGYKLSVFLRELEPNVVRVSLRSPDKVDCNLIAKEFGGGGHKNAAGCTIKEPLNKAIELIVNAGKKHL